MSDKYDTKHLGACCLLSFLAGAASTAVASWLILGWL
jgi:hypothetical protein